VQRLPWGFQVPEKGGRKVIIPRPTYENYVYCANCGLWVLRENAAARCGCGKLYRDSARRKDPNRIRKYVKGVGKNDAAK